MTVRLSDPLLRSLLVAIKADVNWVAAAARNAAWPAGTCESHADDRCVSYAPAIKFTALRADMAPICALASLPS